MADFSNGDRLGCGNVYKMSHPLHANTLLLSLNEIRKNPQLCDGIIVIDGVEIPVQRNILAAASEYFRALYSYELPFNSTDRANLNIASGHFTCDVFYQILDYIYTSVISLTEDNIQSILQAADILLMSDLKELCCDYLEQCICVTNCLGIQEFTERFSCPRVYHVATEYLDEHFLEVSYSEEFLQLPMEKVKEVLSRDSLVIQTEDVIFDCILRWVRFNPEARKSHLEELVVACVHVGLLDECYVQDHVIADELVRSCRLEGLIRKLQREDARKTQRGFTNMIVVAGGEGPSEKDPCVVEIKDSVRCVAFHTSYESRVSCWIDLCPMLQPRIGHGMVEAGGQIYVVGGRDNSGSILRSAERYDPKSNTWTEIASMSHARVGFGLVALDDKIYALGGSNDMSDPMTSVEEYNIYTNKWRQLPDVNLKRAWSACAVCNKRIYLIGGGIMGKVYESVECFDPRSETWVSIAPMKERRFDARAIGFGDDIYVFGGLRRLECPSALQTGSGMKFCATEVYSTEQKHWSVIGRDYGFCTMTDSCHIDAVTKCNNEIVVIGDLDIGGTYNCVRAYQPSINCWRGVIQNHPTNQKGMQGCILKVPTAFACELIKNLDTTNQGTAWNSNHINGARQYAQISKPRNTKHC